MKTLRTYVLKEFFSPFVISLAVFTSITLIGRVTKQAAELIVSKGVAIIPVLKLLAYSVPYLLSFTFPISILSGILLTYGKLSADNEITAMRASGIGLHRIILPQLVFSLLVSIACIPMNDRVVPRAYFQQRSILQEIGWKNPTSLLEPGRPIDDFARYTIFFYEIDRKNRHLMNVTIFEPQADGPALTTVAKSAEFLPKPDEGKLVLRLKDGISDQPNSKDPQSPFRLAFRTWDVTLDLKESGQKSEIKRKIKEMSIREIKEEVERIRRDPESRKLPLTRFDLAVHQRFAFSFACVAFTLIGLPLGITTRRHQTSVGVGLTLALVAAYYLLLCLAEMLAHSGILAAWHAMWLPNFVLSMAGLILMFRMVRV